MMRRIIQRFGLLIALSLPVLSQNQPPAQAVTCAHL